jgi:hypothetical protein
MQLPIFTGVVAAGVMVSSAVLAAGAAFGGAGQLVVSDDQPIGGGVVATSELGPLPPSSTSTVSFEYGTFSDNGGSGTAFGLSPAVDYFVINGLSIGGQGLVAVLNPAHGNSGSGETVTEFGIAPRVGYNLPITDMISFWPKVYFGYLTASASNSNNGVSGSGGSNAAAIGIFAPFIFEPARHFILGIGPNFSTQLSNNQTSSATVMGVTRNTTTAEPKATVFGLQATIGGWFLGD